MAAFFDAKRRRLPELDGLRGMAALAVVFHHFYLTLPQIMQQQVRPFIDWPGLRVIVVGRPMVILFLCCPFCHEKKRGRGPGRVAFSRLT